ncbi:MAG: PIN domain-containing protein [Longimicrobiales bacterium]
MTVVVDTGAALALLDRDARDHPALRSALERRPSEWVLPWATLPEIDYLATTRLGPEAARVFREDVASGQFQVEGLSRTDLQRAVELNRAHADLNLGLVDAVVLAIAERLEARAIATLDLRDFAPVRLRTRPALWPRDLGHS